MSKIIIKRTNELTKAEYARLHTHLHSNGLMPHELQSAYERPSSHAYAILMIKESQIIAWAHLFIPFGTPRFWRKSSWTLHMFVPDNMRRQGIGRRLLEKALTVKERPTCIAWDLNSYYFYTKFEHKIKLKVLPQTHQLLNQVPSFAQKCTLEDNKSKV